MSFVITVHAANHFSFIFCTVMSLVQGFRKKTLKDERVYSFLNENFINIFIDADVNSGAYLKYKGLGVPYTVFLNPDSSLYFKFSGALYADEFLEVIQGVQKNIAEGRTVYEEEPERRKYLPPTELNRVALGNLREIFHEGILDNIDFKEDGLGKGKKSILPATFLYLLNTSRGGERKEHLRWIVKNLGKAVEHRYDSVEGGFFRYTETRDWQIPHYEKMADLNAGVVLLLYTVNQEEPSLELKVVADKT